MTRNIKNSSKNPDADTIDRATEEPVRTLKGMRTVEETLMLEDFPMTKSEIDYSVGDIEVEDGMGNFIPVRLLTDRIRRDRFDSYMDVLRTLKAVRDAMAKKAA